MDKSDKETDKAKGKDENKGSRKKGKDNTQVAADIEENLYDTYDRNHLIKN